MSIYIFFNFGPPKENIFLTTFDGLYFSHQYTNMGNYPQLGIHKINNDNHMISRASSRGDLVIKGKTELRQSAFVNDAAKTWNNAPNAIKLNKSLSGAKREIKQFVLTLPI